MSPDRDEIEIDVPADDEDAGPVAGGAASSAPIAQPGADGGELGDAEMFKAVRILREILDRMSMEVVISTGSPGSKTINISGPDSGLVVGKKGQTLDAIHFVLNRILHRATGKKGFMDIDVEGYRSRREKSLKAQAIELAENASRQGIVVSFDPMNARERRIVHLALSQVSGIRTESRGEGDRRYVQIIPEGVRED